MTDVLRVLNAPFERAQDQAHNVISNITDNNPFRDLSGKDITAMAEIVGHTTMALEYISLADAKIDSGDTAENVKAAYKLLGKAVTSLEQAVEIIAGKHSLRLLHSEEKYLTYVKEDMEDIQVHWEDYAEEKWGVYIY